MSLTSNSAKPSYAGHGMRLPMRKSLLAILLLLNSPIEATAQNFNIAEEEELSQFSLPIGDQQKLVAERVPKASFTDLVNVFSRLTSSQKTRLGPLKSEERKLFQASSGSIALLEQVGIVRALPRELNPLRADVARQRHGDTFENGRIDITADGRTIWTTEISSSGATGLRVEIRSRSVPVGSKIFVTDGHAQVFGPYRAAAEPFWTNTVFGSKIFVQLQFPSAGSSIDDGLTITTIGHLTSFGDRSAVPGGPSQKFLAAAPAECRIIQFCKPAKPVKNPTPAETMLETASAGVAHIVFRKGLRFYLCSGGLIADTRGTQTPFFLTAHHCIASQSSAGSLEAFFKFRTTCGKTPPRKSTLPRTLGSTLLATSDQSDFAFVQLSQAAPGDSHFFRWTPDDVSTSTTDISRLHHPHGFSQHVQNSTVRASGGLCARLPRGQFIYSNPQRGGTLPGSSGSLIFRANGSAPEVVGQLYGACFANPQTCRYSNVDGAFARTFPQIRQYLEQ